MSLSRALKWSKTKLIQMEESMRMHRLLHLSAEIFLLHDLSRSITFLLANTSNRKRLWFTVLFTRKQAKETWHPTKSNTFSVQITPLPRSGSKVFMVLAQFKNSRAAVCLCRVCVLHQARVWSSYGGRMPICQWGLIDAASWFWIG